MKKVFILVAVVMIATVAQAQQKDTFDDNIWGWTEISGDDGEALIKSGVMHIEGKKSGGKSFFSAMTGIGGTKEPSFIETHCYAPFDVTRDFEISCNASVKKITDSNIFGIIIDYMDEGNFVVFSLCEGQATCVRYKDFNIVGRIRQDVKLNKQKNADVKLAVKSTLNKVEFYVNDMKALEVRYLELISNGIGFYVFGKQTVDFDDVEIIQ